MHPPAAKSPVAILILSIIVCAAGFALRVAGIFNDLWLDEIWALQASAGVLSFSDLFSSRTTDGHASLYTLIMGAIGPGRADWIYRVPALAASLAAAFCVYFILRQEKALSRIFGLILYSFSFVFILYGSEARGYAPMLACAAAAFLMLRGEAVIGAGKLVAFWLICSAGFLFHYSFIQFCAALALWSLWIMIKEDGKRGAIRFILLFFPPLALAGLLYFTVIGSSPGGTGPLAPYADAVISAFSMSFGGPGISALSPEQGAIVMGISASVLLALLTEIFMQLRERSRTALFYLLVIFVVPAIVIGISQPRVLLPRYFLCSSLFALFVFGSFMSRIFHLSRTGKLLAPLAMLLIIYGNFIYIKKFMAAGRGQYRAALNYMVSVSGPGHIFISGNHDFRNKTVLDYYAAEAGLTDRITYTTGDSDRAPEAEWYLIQSHDSLFSPPQVVVTGQNTFGFDRSFEYTALSGWNWHLYRKNQPPAPGL